MGKHDKDGKSLRETLQTVEKMTGKLPEEGVNPVIFPESVGHVWGWFLELSNKRPPGMSGPSPIPESEIGWYFRNRHISPTLWELTAISALDRVALTPVEDVD